MALRVSNPNNVKVYTVSGDNLSRSLPDWLERKRRRQLNKDLEFRHRIELLQDFGFPEAAIRIRTTRDGRFAIATGVYKPQMRVYEYAEMSMKFERHTDAENVTFEILSDDWTKVVLLQNDRSVEFHAQGGIHYRTRVPKFGRDLAYHYPSCDLLIGAASNEVYRLNLDQGRFLNVLSTEATSGVNVCEVNPAHQLFGFGTANGTVEFWDPRSRARIGILVPAVPSTTFDDDEAKVPEVTALKFRHDGLSMAVGTSTGHTLLYDLRQSQPWLIKDQQYGLPIRSLHWHEGTTVAADAYDADGTALESAGAAKVISADAKIIKIWDRQTGALFTSIEPSTDINDVCPLQGSGMIFVANESSQMHTYYIPALGPAPRWCSFLDNLTEEMEENPQQHVYDDFKFVTRKELASLGMEHLIGSNVLKAYMHGYFMDLRLYEQAKLIANPFAYEEYRKRAINERLEKQRESRIRAAIKLPKVNRELAARLIQEEANPSKKKKGVSAANILKDERFKDMFTDPDFQVDETTEEYRLLNPGTIPKKPSYREVEEDEEDEMEVDTEPEGHGSDVSSDESTPSETDSDEDLVTQIRRSRGEKVKTRQRELTRSQRESIRPQEEHKSKTQKSKPQKRGPKFYEMGADGDIQSANKSFAERLSSLEDVDFSRPRRRGMRAMESTFRIRSTQDGSSQPSTNGTSSRKSKGRRRH